MSWSLAIKNGDLSLSGTSLAQVTGTAKLVQDLRCALLEPRNFDDHHPNYGSLLDGGRDDSGHEAMALIGENRWDLAAMQVDSEIRKVATEHQKRQVVRLKNDKLTYGVSTLTGDELLLEVVDIKMVQAQDKLLVTVYLLTAQGTNLELDIPLLNPS